METVFFVKISPDSFSPVKSSEQAAGYDLFCIENKDIPPMDRALVRTGLKIQVPVGCYGRLAPRSGLAWKHGIFINAGVIDSDFRGEIKVIMVNVSNTTFQIKKGMKICQLICEKIVYPQVKEVLCLSETKRSGNGFGSSGLF